MIEQVAIFVRCRMSRWTKLFSGGVLISGGLVWCLSPSLKEHSNKWMILTVFVMGSTGVSLAHSAIGNVRRNLTDRKVVFSSPNKQRKDAAVLEPLLPKIRRLHLPAPDRLADTDLSIFWEVTHKTAIIAGLLDGSEEKCDSCIDTIEKFYNTLLHFIEEMDTNESHPRLFDLIEKISKDYKAKHGYPSELIEYGEVIPDEFRELKSEIYGDFEYIKFHVQDLIANKYQVLEYATLTLSEACMHEFIQCPDITKEHRIAISRMIHVISVKFQRTLLYYMAELEDAVENVKAPSLKCETVRILMEELGETLLQQEFDAAEHDFSLEGLFTN